MTNRDDDTPENTEEHDAKYAPVFDDTTTKEGGHHQNNHHPILLGEGNFGQARLMMNKSTGEKVAIKYIPRGKHLDENVVRWDEEEEEEEEKEVYVVVEETFFFSLLLLFVVVY